MNSNEFSICLVARYVLRTRYVPAGRVLIIYGDNMKTLNCFKNFKCLAKECKNNCCIGWEIGIDSETEKLYREGTGEFFDRIRENITDKSPCRFIMDKEGRCPFLNSENLCDIIINLGEDKIPYICKNHPRFYEWVDERCEMGIGLACEEGTRILLSPDADTSLELCEIKGEGLSRILTLSREKIFEIIKSKSVPFKDRLIALLDFACELDDMIFSEDYEEIPDFLKNFKINPCLYEKKDITKDFIEVFKGLIPIDREWTSFINNLPLKAGKINKEDIIKYENLTVYFIFRYFLKGIYDNDILSKVKLSVISVIFLATISPTVYNVSLFSRELEYSEENLDFIISEIYENDIFSYEIITGMITFLFDEEQDSQNN